jgi:hypothetical protein
MVEVGSYCFFKPDVNKEVEDYAIEQLKENTQGKL